VEEAVDRLSRHRFRDEDISVLMHAKTRAPRDFAHESTRRRLKERGRCRRWCRVGGTLGLLAELRARDSRARSVHRGRAIMGAWRERHRRA